MKTYIKPEMEVINLVTEGIIAGSEGVNAIHDAVGNKKQLDNRYEGGWDSSDWTTED